jgi:NAD(P)-dependent dehydrogenase (short-subunit alcohol dehydrogenase family)
MALEQQRLPLRPKLLQALLVALLASLVAALASRRLVAGVVNPHRPNLAGKVVLITGANGGLGFEQARELFLLNATLVVAGRDRKRVDAAAARIRAAAATASCSGTVDATTLLDLSSFASVRAFAASFLSRYSRLDTLVLNAGIMRVPRARTVDGHEVTLQTNHLSHHLLTALLLPTLRATAAATGDARVLAVSSVGHVWAELDAVALADLSFDRRNDTQAGFAPYTQSKLANVLFAAELARRESDAASGVTAFSLHPGAVLTDIFSHVDGFGWLAPYATPFLVPFFKTALEGAQTQIYLAAAPLADVKPYAGAYFVDCAPAKANPIASDAQIARELWRVSDELVGLSEKS